MVVSHSSEAVKDCELTHWHSVNAWSSHGAPFQTIRAIRLRFSRISSSIGLTFRVQAESPNITDMAVLFSGLMATSSKI